MEGTYSGTYSDTVLKNMYSSLWFCGCHEICVTTSHRGTTFPTFSILRIHSNYVWLFCCVCHFSSFYEAINFANILPTRRFVSIRVTYRVYTTGPDIYFFVSMFHMTSQVATKTMSNSILFPCALRLDTFDNVDHIIICSSFSSWFVTRSVSFRFIFHHCSQAC